MEIFHQIYVLAHEYGIPPQYVESLPPADRAVFVMFVEKEIAEKEKAAENESY